MKNKFIANVMANIVLMLSFTFIIATVCYATDSEKPLVVQTERLKNGFVYEGGKYYFYKNNILKKNGFIKIGKKLYRTDKNGAKITNKTLKIKSITYRFNKKGLAKVIKVKLKVRVIAQRPEMPVGCEITSVTMMLRYGGAKISKGQLARKLSKNSDPNKGYQGNPWGRFCKIYPKAFKKVVKKYSPNGKFKNLTGVKVEKLKAQLRKTHPIVVWISSPSLGWHSIVLTGYSKKFFYYNDPWTVKKTKISIKHFKSVWAGQNKRALSY